MRSNLHLRNEFVWACLAVVCFAVVVLLIHNEGISGFDSTVISTVQGWESDGLTRVMESFSWLGSTNTVIILSVLLLLFLAIVLGHRLELLFFIATLGGSSLLNRILKSLFQRERPDFHRLVEETGFSFPSGHSMGAFALYGALTYLLWKHVGSGKGRVLLIGLGAIIVIGIGVSRIYLGVHYPSDVLGGYLVSGTWLGLMIGLFRKKSYTGKVGSNSG